MYGHRRRVWTPIDVLRNAWKSRILLSPALFAIVAGIVLTAELGTYFAVDRRMTGHGPRETSTPAAHAPVNTLTPTPASTPLHNGAPSSAIAPENANPGTYDWLIPPDQASTTWTQAYASATSVAPGQAGPFT
jgi:hypothetical protein